MDQQMTFNGAVHGHNVVAGTTVTGGATANFNFNGGAPTMPSTPLHIIPYPRNEDIVGRNEIFARIWELRNTGSQNIALWGLGGSGKTQIALETAYRLSDKEDIHIFWVHADTKRSFTQDYQRIARRVGLPGGLVGEELFESVADFICGLPRWLLVLDNADNLSMFGVGVQAAQSPNENYFRHIPKGSSGTVLWTSRDEGIVDMVSTESAINIKSMHFEEAKELLETVRGRKLDKLEVGDAEELLLDLHSLPLAVSQAAAYMRRTRTPIGRYLLKLEQERERWKLLKKTQFDRHRRHDATNCVLETWNISFQRLKEEDEMSIRILNVVAYVDHQNITMGMIRAAAATMGGENAQRASTASEDKSDFDDDVREAIGRLQDFSFLQQWDTSYGTAVYDMHPLVQEATHHFHQTSHGAEHQAYFIKAALHGLTRLFPDLQREKWDNCEKYILHVRAVDAFVQAFAQRNKCSAAMAGDEAKALVIRAEDYDKHINWWSQARLEATEYGIKGMDEEAERIVLQLLDEQRRVFSENHVHIAQTKEFLVAAYLDLGRYAEAEKLAREVTNQRRSVHMYRDRRTNAVVPMVKVLLEYIRHDMHLKAEKLCMDILAMRQGDLGKHHPETIDSMRDLAYIYSVQQKHSRARAYYDAVTAIEQGVQSDEGYYGEEYGDEAHY